MLGYPRTVAGGKIANTALSIGFGGSFIGGQNMYSRVVVRVFVGSLVLPERLWLRRDQFRPIQGALVDDQVRHQYLLCHLFVGRGIRSLTIPSPLFY